MTSSRSTSGTLFWRELSQRDRIISPGLIWKKVNSISPLCEALSSMLMHSREPDSDERALHVYPRVLSWPPASEPELLSGATMCLGTERRLSFGYCKFCFSWDEVGFNRRFDATPCLLVIAFIWIPILGVLVLCTVKSCFPSAWVLLFPPTEASRSLIDTSR